MGGVLGKSFHACKNRYSVERGNPLASASGVLVVKTPNGKPAQCCDFSYLLDESRKTQRRSVNWEWVRKLLHTWCRANPSTYEQLSNLLPRWMTPKSKLTKLSSLMVDLQSEGLVRELGGVRIRESGVEPVLWAGDWWFDNDVWAIAHVWDGPILYFYPFPWEELFCVACSKTKWQRPRVNLFSEMVVSMIARLLPRAAWTRFVGHCDGMPDAVMEHNGSAIGVHIMEVHRAEVSPERPKRMIECSTCNDKKLLILGFDDDDITIVETFVGNENPLVFVGRVSALKYTASGHILVRNRGKPIAI
jgi:hypothetical protein